MIKYDDEIFRTNVMINGHINNVDIEVACYIKKLIDKIFELYNYAGLDTTNLSKELENL